MNGNIRRLRWVFMTGSAIPASGLYFLVSSPRWEGIDSPTFRGLLTSHAGLNGLLQALREVVASPHVELAVHLFADLALATSFLGVALGLFDYPGRSIPAPQYGVRTPANRADYLSAAAGVCAFLPTWICDGIRLCRRSAGSTGTAHPCHAGLAMP